MKFFEMLSWILPWIIDGIKKFFSCIQWLKWIIQGKQYVIMNAKDKIQDTIIGTIASILSMSALYKEGTVVITMAYNADKIKVSSRISGRGKKAETRNLKEMMNEVTDLIGGESGGHKMAAGCIISKEKEEAFIDIIQKKLDVGYVKI